MSGEQEEEDEITNKRLLSSSINTPISIEIGSLMGPIAKILKTSPDEELELAWMVSLVMHGRPLVGELETRQQIFTKTRERPWNETINLTIPISKTTIGTCITLNLVERDKNERVVAGTTLYLYETKKKRADIKDVDNKQNGNGNYNNSNNNDDDDDDDKEIQLRQGHFKLLLWPERSADYPPFEKDCPTDSRPDYSNSPFKDLDKVEKQLLKEYDDGFVEPELFHQHVNPDSIRALQLEEACQFEHLYVLIKLPSFGQAIYYDEPKTVQKTLEERLLYGANPVVKFWKEYRKFYDEDPTKIEPGAKTYDHLVNMMMRPLTWRWTPEDRAVLWKYRYWLRRFEQALPKFILIVDWDDRNEIAMIADVLLGWCRPSSIWTCVELMAVDGPYQSEDINLIWSCSLSKFLNQENVNLDLNTLLMVLPSILEYFGNISLFQSYFPQESSSLVDSLADNNSGSAVNLLVDFLIAKALGSESFCQRLFWSLKLKSKEISTSRLEPKRDNVYARFLGQLLHQIQKNGKETELQLLLKEEHLFFNKIFRLLRDPRMERMSRLQRIAYLKKTTADPANGILSFTTTPLPYDAQSKVTGTLPEKLNVYKSNAMPIKIVFVTEEIQEHAVIIKTGEDLRQDMFVLNILQFVDMIWQRAGLDLQLNPYRCMAMAVTEGILEFIPSESLSTIINAYSGSLRNYLASSSSSISNTSFESNTLVQKAVSDFTELTLTENGKKILLLNSSVESSTIAIPELILENFIKSCAGYCVFTFVMGIGDRHLENLLLTKDGRLFHVDFAYLYGRDPRPFPPPMKICREMVEAMGGPTSASFERFKSICFSAFSVLRRNAAILIALIEISGSAAGNGSDAGAKYVHEKLMLEIDEIDALITFEKLIDESIHALFPKLFETFHKWAQYWRQ